MDVKKKAEISPRHVGIIPRRVNSAGRIRLQKRCSDNCKEQDVS